MLTGVGFLSALLVGLFGGVHCVGMCGGIVGALGMSLPRAGRRTPLVQLPYLLAYNLGRILSYTLAGALMGGAGAWLMAGTGLRQAQGVLQLLAGVFMLLLGLYLAGWWSGLAHIERLGSRFWRHLEPLGQRLLPVRSLPGALGLGLVWGWLPCGLVYSVLIWSLSAGGAAEGALLMLGFGLGTLPTLMLMGLVAARLAAWVRRPWSRRVAGTLVLAFGVHTLLLAVRGLSG